MECKKCGAQWTTRNSLPYISKCPFCGVDLATSDIDTTTSIEEIMRYITGKFGMNILLQHERFLAVFSDIAPQMKKERTILSIVLGSGIINVFLQCSGEDKEKQIKKIVHDLEGILADDAIEMVVASLSGLLGWDLRSTVKKFVSQQSPPNVDKSYINKRDTSQRKVIIHDVVSSNNMNKNANGYFDKDIYDYNGFDWNGIHKDTGTRYSPSGFDINGHDRYGFSKNRIHKDTRIHYSPLGFDVYGIHRTTGTRYSPSGYDRDGYDRNGYDNSGFDKYGFNKRGYDRNGYDKNGYNMSGIHKETGTLYSPSGYDKSGHDKDGYDKDGYRFGYDREGYDREGYDREGYKKHANPSRDIETQTSIPCYDEYGYDKDGYDRNGFNKNGIHKTTGTKYSPNGYTKNDRDFQSFMREMRSKIRACGKKT